MDVNDILNLEVSLFHSQLMGCEDLM
jgi:hypothetical protein